MHSAIFAVPAHAGLIPGTSRGWEQEYMLSPHTRGVSAAVAWPERTSRPRNALAHAGGPLNVRPDEHHATSPDRAIYIQANRIRLIPLARRRDPVT